MMSRAERREYAAMRAAQALRRAENEWRYWLDMAGAVRNPIRAAEMLLKACERDAYWRAWAAHWAHVERRWAAA